MGSEELLKEENKATAETAPETPEIQEIQERGSMQPETADSPKKKGIVPFLLLGVLGGLLVAAVTILAVCLYRTSADLRVVQTTSKGLQIKLKTTETKLEEVLSEAEGKQTNSGVFGEEQPGETGKASPTKTPRPTPVPEVYTVCIDAGHGGHDTGAVQELEDGTVRMEKDDALRMAELVRTELEAFGVKVLMTRTDDSFLELYDRTLVANSMDADALISFHRNAYYSGGKMSNKVGGVEVWIHSSRPTDARQLANGVLDAILEVGGLADRGVRYGSMTDSNEDYAINRRSLVPSMIVEMGFISNPSDNEALDANGEAYAKAIAKVIYEWLEQQK